MFELIIVLAAVLAVIAVFAVVAIIAESHHRAFYARMDAKFDHLR